MNIAFDVSLPWPSLDTGGAVRFAYVGRLHPRAEGRDLLLEALAEPPWRDRPWKFYIEAKLCARLVVATDIAGHQEIIEDGVTGFLADAPTAASISAGPDPFWARRGEAEDIGKAGARTIRQLVPPDPIRAFSDKLHTIAERAVSGQAFSPADASNAASA